jgi:hypothetical protein
MSASGQYQTAVIFTGSIYYSNNYGITWNATTYSGNWLFVAISASGQYQTAVIQNGGIYTSVLPINISSALTLNNDPGGYPQVLTSQGPNLPPFWTTPSGLSKWTNGPNNSIYYTLGFVGIGTTNPGSALDVTGNLNLSGSATATSFNATSDYRIKENIQLLGDSFNTNNLIPVTYVNKKTGIQDIGLIAHELQDIYPFLVRGEKDGSEMQSINYIGLIGILIKEIQDLKKEVATLSTLSTFKKG